MRTNDLQLFGRFAFDEKSEKRTVCDLLNALRNGSDSIAALAQAWDDEQRASGLAWKTRSRRRDTLRSIVAFAAANGAAPRKSAIAPLARDATPVGDVASRASFAIRTAIETHRWRDAAIVALVWDIGASVPAIQRLRVDDLPIAWASDRAALAISHVASGRPSAAFVFASRDASKPIDARTIRDLLRRLGLPTMIQIRRARDRCVRALGYHPTDTRAARALERENA